MKQGNDAGRDFLQDKPKLGKHVSPSPSALTLSSIKKITTGALVFIQFVLLAGCLNMPTPPSQITGSYTSGLKYENFHCSDLATELNSLARRENQLVIAQEQRIKTSETQAFWWGYGQGDGIEASELSNVRGEKEAVRKAIEAEDC